MAAPRKLEPEWLDHLPHDDPDALRSRMDLRRINVLMGNFRWIVSTLDHLGAGAGNPRVIELGAGDGSLARVLGDRLPGLRYRAIDLAPPPADLPEGFEWAQGDLFELLPTIEGDILIANLFLHHFDESALRRIGEAAAGFSHLVLSEPLRLPHCHALGHAMRLLGINRVTRHDLHISIDAGFVEQELPRLLDPENARWSFEVTGTLLGAYRVQGRAGDRIPT